MRGLGDHLLHPLSVEVLLIPQHISEEVLQPLRTGPWHRLGDGIAVLLGQLGEQPRRIALQRLPACRPPKAHLQRTQKLLKLRHRCRTALGILWYPHFPLEDTTVHRILTE